MADTPVTAPTDNDEDEVVTVVSVWFVSVFSLCRMVEEEEVVGRRVGHPDDDASTTHDGFMETGSTRCT